MQKTLANQAKLQKILPELMTRVTATQAKLHNIDSHLAISLAAVNKNTPAFERCSELFRVVIEEIAQSLLSTCDTIDQIEEATEQVVVGVRKELGSGVNQPIPVQDINPSTVRSIRN